MSVRILIGDCREKLRELADGSVHCCVTSPPYFGLRDYGTAQWAGGDPECDHKVGRATRGGLTSKQASSLGSFGDESVRWGEQCPHCGATRIDRQMGLEPTPDEFVAGMVEVFREVRRVLRDDGTLWLNIGDSYASAPGKNNTNLMEWAAENAKGGGRRAGLKDTPTRGAIAGYKQKDLIGIPWMLAFALRADGWYLRQDVIWSKPNPMPESVRDRCTKAHEYMFLLSKGPRYYFDAEAIAEPLAYAPHAPGNTKLDASRNDHDQMQKVWGANGTRNKRSVWEVATQPYSEAHFATYPPALIEPCILAGCPVSGTVLDPFGGAGTTGLVADRLGRNAILIELNPKYAAIAERRLTADAGMFAEVKAA